MKKTPLASYLRLLILFLLLLYVSLESYLHMTQGGLEAPSAHALCPFGALESLYSILFSGKFLQKIYSGTMIIFLVTLVLALLFRRSFCGLLCPFGALQELFARIGQKLVGKRLTIPSAIDRPFRYLKFPILVLTVLMAWTTATLWMSPYDPYAAYSHIWGGFSELMDEFLVGFILLIITVVGSFLFDRFFCKYLCPAGAFYGLVGKISPNRIERNDSECIHCQTCSKVCPANIDVEKEYKVTTLECLNCNECVFSCPKEGALEIKEGKRILTPVTVLVLVLALFFIPIAFTQALGIYRVLPQRLKVSESIKLEEVKGFMTIKEASEYTKLDLKEFYTRFKIPENVPPETKMKGIRNTAPDYDFEKIKKDIESRSKGHETISRPTDKGPIKVDVSQVRGSMSTKEAAEFLGLEVKEFYKVFHIPEKVPPETRMREIGKQVPGYDFHAVKDSVEKTK
jgi:ferredoxin